MTNLPNQGPIKLIERKLMKKQRCWKPSEVQAFKSAIISLNTISVSDSSLPNKFVWRQN